MRNKTCTLGAVLALGLLFCLSICSCRSGDESEVAEPTTRPFYGGGTSPTSSADVEPVESAPVSPQAEPSADTPRTYAPPTDAEIAAAKAAGTRKATIRTTKGDIVVELYGGEAPLTVSNFVNLVEAGFYKGLTFHRVVPGFVIQGGCPNGDGSGGPGYTIKREIAPGLKHVEGALAMARTSEPDSAGCQFYITLAPTPQLDSPPNGPYAVFGKTISGMDVVKRIAVGDTIKDIVLE